MRLTLCSRKSIIPLETRDVQVLYHSFNPITIIGLSMFLNILSGIVDFCINCFYGVKREFYDTSQVNSLLKLWF